MKKLVLLTALMLAGCGSTDHAIKASVARNAILRYAQHEPAAPIQSAGSVSAHNCYAKGSRVYCLVVFDGYSNPLRYCMIGYTATRAGTGIKPDGGIGCGNFANGDPLSGDVSVWCEPKPYPKLERCSVTKPYGY
jgi:hypothetical protein